MAIELIIEFDGTSESLREHRLSVAAFSPALTLLRVGLRQAARKIERGVDVDLELRDLGQGSTIPAFVVTIVSAIGLLAYAEQEIATNAATSFVRDIEGEARGEARNHIARRYLAAMPSMVSTQRYRLRRDGAELLDVPIGAVGLPELAVDLARLRTAECLVLGVQFAPAATSVEIQIDGKRYWCEATEAQIDRALALRGTLAHATIVGRHPSWRLVALRDHAYVAPSPAERSRMILSRWAGLLQRLAS
jgi:hypothetical protein